MRPWSWLILSIHTAAGVMSYGAARHKSLAKESNRHRSTSLTKRYLPDDNPCGDNHWVGRFCYTPEGRPTSNFVNICWSHAFHPDAEGPLPHWERTWEYFLAHGLEASRLDRLDLEAGTLNRDRIPFGPGIQIDQLFLCANGATCVPLPDPEDDPHIWCDELHAVESSSDDLDFGIDLETFLLGLDSDVEFGSSPNSPRSVLDHTFGMLEYAEDSDNEGGQSPRHVHHVKAWTTVRKDLPRVKRLAAVMTDIDKRQALTSSVPMKVILNEADTKQHNDNAGVLLCESHSDSYDVCAVDLPDDLELHENDMITVHFTLEAATAAVPHHRHLGLQFVLGQPKV